MVVGGVKPPVTTDIAMHLAVLERALRHLLPPGAAVAATDPKADHPTFPGEIIAAIPARRREFAAGRAALRAAMAELGLPPVAVPMRPNRAPDLPPGLAASITHGATACLAAAMRGPRALGIDLEEDAALPHELRDIILTPAERAVTHVDPSAARLIFAAKEAFYKAQYPITGTLLDFQAVEISLMDQRFVATLRSPVPGLPTGVAISGRWVRAAEHLLIAVVID